MVGGTTKHSSDVMPHEVVVLVVVQAVVQAVVLVVVVVVEAQVVVAVAGLVGCPFARCHTQVIVDC